AWDRSTRWHRVSTACCRADAPAWIARRAGRGARDTVLNRGIELKSSAQIERMRQAGLVVARTLRRVRREADVGMTTADLDAIARECLDEHGATSNFLNYGAQRRVPGFPGVMCTSVNNEVVHGIPDERRLAD